MTFSLGSCVGVRSALSIWLPRRGVAILACDSSSAVFDFFSNGLIEPFSGAWRTVRARRAGGRGMSGYARRLFAMWNIRENSIDRKYGDRVKVSNSVFTD